MTAQPPGGGPSDRRYRSEVGAMLEELSQEIEALGAALCRNPAVVESHLHELQAFDRIAQKQRSLSALLIADCMASAARAVPLDEVAQRLRDLA